MIIDTETLKKALDYLSMGIAKSNDKYETQLVEFETSNGRLKAYTSDDVNKLGIRICDTTDTLNVTLKFDMLYNLVKACKDNQIEIKAAKNYAEFTTNIVSCRLSTFSHSIARPQFLKYTGSMNSEVIREYMPIIKSMIDTSHAVECYRYVYFGDNIMATDTDNVAIIDESIFNNMLMQLHSLEILSSFDDFEYILDGNTLCACSGGKIVEISLMDKSKYQYTDLMELFNNAAKNTISLSKDILSNAISTASLFAPDTVELVFDDNGARIEIPNDNFKYVLSSNKCASKTYKVTLHLLKRFLVIGTDLTIGYDEDTLISVNDGKIKTIFGVDG